jgi:succinate dehydrogenase / fumarate reductase flavoprotein subunit
MAQQPILIYPTLHYQNGGIEINDQGETRVKNLYAAGEVSGGVHGRNRLMGNSLLDILVFGRRAGLAAAARARTAKPGKLTLDHVTKWNDEVRAAGMPETRSAPVLLPSYARRA